MEYIKPALSLIEQVSLLQDRGLIITDQAKAMRYLEHIGYYRLSAYMIPFYQDKVAHQFKDDVSFENVLNLYIFDRKLRLLILEAIERIEISFRSNIINIFASELEPYAYLKPEYFDTRYQHDWLTHKISNEIDKSSEAFIQHYKNKYTQPKLPPIWMALHLLTFKEISVFHSKITSTAVKQKIAEAYGLKEPVLESWMRSLSDLRNLCAHHSRIWNRTFGVKAVIPKSKPKHWLSTFPVLIDIGNNQKISPRNSLYYQVVIIWYFISQMNSQSTWLNRLIKLCQAYQIDMKYLGFSDDWRKDEFWRRSDGSHHL